VLLCAVGSWLYTNRPERLRAFRNQQARQRIDPYELSNAGDGNPRNVPAELVAVLGDSRLKHWNDVLGVEILAGNQLATRGRDGQIRLWDLSTGRQLHQFDGIGLAVSGDRKQAFFAATDGTIRCWNVAQSRTIKVLPLAPVVPPVGMQSVGMAANTDGSVLVTESRNAGGAREIIVWDVTATTRRYRPAQPRSGDIV
jgi:WD40 repeat protein